MKQFLLSLLTTRVIICFLFVLFLCACNDSKEGKPITWEYKILTISDPPSNKNKLSMDSSEQLSDTLNKLGNDGWELVNAYTVTKTGFPNFGVPGYVVGIKSNVRTSSLSLILKRPLRDSKLDITTNVLDSLK